MIENYWKNLQITTFGLHYAKMVKYDNWCTDRLLCDKSTKLGTNGLSLIGGLTNCLK